MLLTSPPIVSPALTGIQATKQVAYSPGYFTFTALRLRRHMSTSGVPLHNLFTFLHQAMMQATPAKGKAAKAAAEAEDPETTAALQKVAAAIAKLPKEPGSFSLMAKQEGGGYVQGGDSVPPPRHGSKVTSMCTSAEISKSLASLQSNNYDRASCQLQSCTTA